MEVAGIAGRDESEPVLAGELCGRGLKSAV
jgi:hypothetical protein